MILSGCASSGTPSVGKQGYQLSRACEQLAENVVDPIEAGTVIEAATVLASGPTVHLVFSDVDLPGATGGLSLAVWMNIHHPDVPVILTSGVRAVMPTLADQRRVPFIPKPYDFEKVAALIAEVIAGRFRQS